MTRAEIKIWAKEKIKGKMWEVLGVCLLSGIISGVTASVSSTEEISGFVISLTIPFIGGILTLFMDVGLVRWMTNFIHDKETKIELLFSKFKDWKQVIITYFHQYVMVLLFTLLFIIPGIIKSFSYSLVSYILADDSNMTSKEILDLSSKMMKGHKMELFVFELSFIGWHLLAILTLGILEIWILPYQRTATTKFLLNIKEQYKKDNTKKELTN